MKITGTLVEKVNDTYTLIEDNQKKKYFIASLFSINKLFEGKVFSAEVFPQCNCFKLIKNINGKYKLLFSIKPKLENFSSFNYFKEILTEDIIAVYSSAELNSGIIGENYDLEELARIYESRSILANLPENKNPLYTKVLISSQTNDQYYLGYIGDQKIVISSETKIPSIYIGRTVLLELQQKYIATAIIPGDKLFKPNNSDYQYNANQISIDEPQQLILTKLDKNDPTYQLRINVKTLFTLNKNNIGKIININTCNIKFVLFETFQQSEDKTDNQLLSIVSDKYAKHNISLFRLKDGEIAITRIPFLQGCDDKLGTYFKFDYLQLHYVKQLSYSNDPNEYTLVSNVNAGYHIFTKNGLTFPALLGEFKISDNSIGRFFNLELSPYALTGFINDVKN